MVYTMQIYTDGGCRGNGRPYARGAAAAVFMNRGGGYKAFTRVLLPDSPSPPPTSQRAELTAIIIALEEANAQLGTLRTNPWLDVTIYTDSKYAFGCMTKWKDTWRMNGMINSKGREVVNRDLIEEAYDLEDMLNKEGDLQYEWIPRGENQIADEICDQILAD